MELDPRDTFAGEDDDVYTELARRKAEADTLTELYRDAAFNLADALRQVTASLKNVRSALHHANEAVSSAIGEMTIALQDFEDN